MKRILPALRIYLVLTVILGFAYPLLMTGLSKLIFPRQAAGSLVKNSSGVVVGSTLIGQKFTKPQYFWVRPSAVDYNPLPSGGSNLGPTSEALKTAVEERRRNGAVEDLLFASASGLDPHISFKAAESQIARVATSRKLSPEVVHGIVQSHVEKRELGIFGEERVNVLTLNLALDRTTEGP